MAETSAATVSRATLTLITRRDCTLCDEFHDDLLRWDGGRQLFTLTLVDVDESPALELRYGFLVPVLLLGDEQLCSGHFNPGKLAGRLLAS